VNAATLGKRLEQRLPPAPGAREPVDKNERLAGTDDPILGSRPVDHKLADLHDDQFGTRGHGGRDVFTGLVVTTGRIGATTS
jgi:hypothetical protein